jgi:hypothetical protein
MASIRILILNLLQFSCVYFETVIHDFKVSKNQSIDLGVSKTCLISSVNKSSRMTCMGSCNFNSHFVTVVFDQSKEINKNCFMYNRYFKYSELILSSTSTVYEQKIR